MVIAAGAVVFWLATGANRGWTKTLVPVKVLDPVTGIEGVNYEKGFVPGVDFLGAALLTSGILGGVSLLYKRPPPKA
jgi:hypothetical protein